MDVHLLCHMVRWQVRDAPKPINVRKLQARASETMVTGAFGVSIGRKRRSSGRVWADGESVAVLAGA